MIILDHTYKLNSQSLQIFVKYNEVTQTVIEVKNVILHSHGMTIPVGNLLREFFHEGITQLINATDWQPICAEFLNPDRRGNNVHQVFQPIINSLVGR